MAKGSEILSSQSFVLDTIKTKPKIKVTEHRVLIKQGETYMNKIQKSIAKDGFCTISNVLSPQEIEELRTIISKYMAECDISSRHRLYGKTQPNAAATVPDLAWIFYHPKILSIMEELLQTENIMFTSHCDVHSQTLRGWHKDDGMRVMKDGYFEQPTYDLDDCRVYKVGIYLQDHHRNLGGLKVRRKSHRFSDRNSGEEVYLATRAGDIVVFDVRLTHSGQTDVVPIPIIRKPIGLFLKVLQKLSIPHKGIESRIKNIYDGIVGDRLSIFFTFGVNNEYTIKFSQNNMRRQLAQDPNAPIYLSTDLREKLLEKGVLLAEDHFSNLKSLETIKH